MKLSTIIIAILLTCLTAAAFDSASDATMDLTATVDGQQLSIVNTFGQPETIATIEGDWQRVTVAYPWIVVWTDEHNATLIYIADPSRPEVQ